MNLCFYEALERLPLGIAVTLEFVGPLAVAIAGTRNRLDLLWVVLAGAGIVLLGPDIGNGLDALGVVLALTAGAFWGAYILMSARVGRGQAGLGGLSLAMVISAVLLIPVGVADGGADLLQPGRRSRSASASRCSARRSPTPSSWRRCAAFPSGPSASSSASSRQSRRSSGSPCSVSTSSGVR